MFHQKGTHILGRHSKTVFLSNLTIFYRANPYFGTKLSIFVASRTRNTTIYGCRLYRFWWKFNIGSPKSFMKSRNGTNDIFLVQPPNILHSQPAFWSKVEYFRGCFDQKHNFIWSLITDTNKNHSWFINSRVHESWASNQRQVSSPTSPFYTKPILTVEENRQVLLLFWSKTHMCMVLDWYYTI